jgi:hypothetical protein
MPALSLKGNRMNDPDVKLGWTVLKAIPNDGSDRSYEARLAIHSLVWELWRLRDDLRRTAATIEGQPEVSA